MDKKPNLTIRKASVQEDNLIAKHFYQLWLDNDVTSECILSDWREITLEFIDKARQNLSFQAFVAEVNSQIVG